jgi:hypothetical protein
MSIDELRQDAISKLEITDAVITATPGAIHLGDKFDVMFRVRNNSWLTFRNVRMMLWTTEHTKFVNGEPEPITVPVLAPNAPAIQMGAKLEAVSSEELTGQNVTDCAGLTVWADVEITDLLKDIAEEHVSNAVIYGHSQIGGHIPKVASA